MQSLEILDALERKFGSLQEVQIRALRNDSELLAFLLQNPPPQAYKARFFTKINDALIFEKEAFLEFLKLRILDSSYTKFANKIGLKIATHSKESLLKSDSHIVLNFPYKDCILKGAQTKDSDKANEIFFNEILASDEIDVLLKPKALQNFEFISPTIANADFCKSSPSLAEGDKGGGYKNAKDSKNAKFANVESTHPLTPSAREGEQNGKSSLRELQRDSWQFTNDKAIKSALQNKPNLLIKGNNLLALHTLKARKDIYGQVKLIYIDPPYNTGNDSFNYNDRFNHSAWLTFMKNRLEIAREFLREDGVIFIQCDDNEQAYLKVLCDEIFGRENFVATICWEKKYSPANDAKWLSDNHDFILLYAKRKETWKPNLLPRTEEMNARYTNPDNDPRGRWKTGGFSVKTYTANYDYPITTPSGKIVYPPSGSCWQTSKENYEKMLKDNRIYFGKNGDSKPQIKQFLSEVQQGVVTKTFWKYDECGHNQIGKQEIKALFANSKNSPSLAEGARGWVDSNQKFTPPQPLPQGEGLNVPLFATPKPEALLKRIIEISTKENDLVMDFFAGSGTTCAVAHKMKRRWVGIEQMDYVESITKERLIKVINGEQGGVSKAVGWNPNTPPQTPPARGGAFYDSPSLAEGDKGGGSLRGFEKAEAIHESKIDCHENPNGFSRNDGVENSFIYAELMPLNALYKARIVQSQSDDELNKIYKDLQEKAFVDYRVDIKEMLKDKDFEVLNLEDKKRILCEILDSNMDYVPFSDIEDSSYGVSSEIIELNKAFYGDL